MAIAEELVAAADRELVPQQRLGRHEDERLAERAQHLAAQDVEIIGRRRDVADLDIVAGAQLQESFEPRGTMLRSLPFISVRQQQHKPVGAPPFRLAAHIGQASCWEREWPYV